MKEHPILFSGPMVRAILEGRKTQTRRIVKGAFVVDEREDTGALWPLVPSYVNGGDNEGEPICCPYGQPGDRLWVRETWQVATGRISGDLGACVRYRDTELKACWMPPDKVMPIGLTWDHWRPSIHMPRWASRITLDVVSVRVERLQQITNNDAMREGFDGWNDPAGEYPDVEPWQQFAELWNRLNSKRATWASNPWVWVLEFRREG